MAGTSPWRSRSRWTLRLPRWWNETKAVRHWSSDCSVCWLRSPGEQQTRDSVRVCRVGAQGSEKPVGNTCTINRLADRFRPKVRIVWNATQVRSLGKCARRFRLNEQSEIPSDGRLIDVPPKRPWELKRRTSSPHSHTHVPVVTTLKKFWNIIKEQPSSSSSRQRITDAGKWPPTKGKWFFFPLEKNERHRISFRKIVLADPPVRWANCCVDLALGTHARCHNGQTFHNRRDLGSIPLRKVALRRRIYRQGETLLKIEQPSTERKVKSNKNHGRFDPFAGEPCAGGHVFLSVPKTYRPSWLPVPWPSWNESAPVESAGDYSVPRSAPDSCSCDGADAPRGRHRRRSTSPPPLPR